MTANMFKWTPQKSIKEVTEDLKDSAGNSQHTKYKALMIQPAFKGMLNWKDLLLLLFLLGTTLYIYIFYKY